MSMVSVVCVSGKRNSLEYWYIILEISVCFKSPWFPPGLENRENLEKWEGIFQSGKSQGILLRLEKSGNFTQNTGKIILENFFKY